MDTLYIWLQTWRDFPYLDSLVILFIFIFLWKTQNLQKKFLFFFIGLHWFILNPIVKTIISAIVDSSLYWRLPDSIIALRYLFYFIVVYYTFYSIIKLENVKLKKFAASFLSFFLFFSPLQQLLRVDNFIEPGIDPLKFTITSKDQYEGPEQVVNIFENPNYLDEEIISFFEQVSKNIPERSKVVVTETDRLKRFSRYLTTINVVNYNNESEAASLCLNPLNELIDVSECRKKLEPLDYDYVIVEKTKEVKNDY
ncbi:MAG: hypothetical protein ACRCSG_01755, partial [Cellulosilyticaceae bacterium]